MLLCRTSAKRSAMVSVARKSSTTATPGHVASPFLQETIKTWSAFNQLFGVIKNY